MHIKFNLRRKIKQQGGRTLDGGPIHIYWEDYESMLHS